VQVGAATPTSGLGFRLRSVALCAVQASAASRLRRLVGHGLGFRLPIRFLLSRFLNFSTFSVSNFLDSSQFCLLLLLLLIGSNRVWRVNLRSDYDPNPIIINSNPIFPCRVHVGFAGRVKNCQPYLNRLSVSLWIPTCTRTSMLY
jgi:hypothetical protein